MAQRHHHGGGTRGVARRLGISGGGVALPAFLALACAAGGYGAARQANLGGMVIERAEADEVPGQADESDAVAQSGEGQPDAGQVELHYVVHVDGAVGSPGVVELDGSDVRVRDAVDAAGGLLGDADTTGVNLAEPLVDGSKVHIPREGEQAQPEEVATRAGQTATSGATGAGSASALVNLNTATSEELQTLSGVGEATANAIIEDREQNGPFASPEDLMRVSGIGEKKFAKVKDHVCV